MRLESFGFNFVHRNEEFNIPLDVYCLTLSNYQGRKMVTVLPAGEYTATICFTGKQQPFCTLTAERCVKLPDGCLVPEMSAKDHVH